MYSILYVDDESELLELGKLFLEQSGQFSVDIITSAPEALAILNMKTYDAIISDFQMPDMNGIDFLQRVRTSGNTIPFILFTGRGREDVVIQAINSGVDFYLQKGGEPVAQFAELEHKIHQAIQKRRAEAGIRDLERQQADIINFLPDATFAIDTRGVVIAWNRAMEELTSVTAAEMLGKGNYEYAIPAYHKRQPILIDLVLNEDPVHLKKYPLVKRVGHTIITETTSPFLFNGRGATLWMTATPLYNTQGTVVGAIQSIRDITERKEIEEALRGSEEKFRTLFESAGDAIFIMDHEIFLDCNKKTEVIFGSARDQIIGKSPITFSPERQPDGRLSAEKAKEKIEATILGDPQIFEWVHLRSDGTPFFAEVSLTRIIMRGVTCLQAIVRDITDRKEKEQNLQSQTDKLNAAYEQLTAAEEELRGQYEELSFSEKRIRESEEKYRTVFENTGTATIIIENDATISLVNSEFERVSGYPRSEIENKKKWMEFIVKEDLDRMLEQHRLRRTDRKRALIQYEFRFISRSGEIRDIYLTIDAIPGTTKSVASLLDITERKEVETRLVATNREYMELLDQIQDVYYRCDHEGRLTRASRSWATLLGYEDISECIGRGINEFYLNPADRKQFLEELYRKGDVINYEARFRRKDGVPVVVEISSHLTYDSAGNIHGIEGTFRDITKRKRAEEVVLKANNKLTMLNDIIQHNEINTMAGLFGMIAMARDPSYHSEIESLLNEMQTLAETIHQQIEFIRYYQAAGVREPYWQSLPETVSRAIAQFTGSEISIFTDITGFEMYADPLFEKVFTNLIQNMISNDQSLRTIRVNGHPSDGGFLIICEDDGAGIPSTRQKKIFELGIGQHSGMGLFLAKEILAITGITIRETGEPGKGARFEMTVPKEAWRIVNPDT
jgi:PAS domain S-box-containing protein